MGNRSRESYVAVGLETVPGTPATTANMRRLDADFTFPGLELTKPLRDDASAPHGLPGVPALAATSATLELTVPMDVASEVRTAAGDPISPPPYDALLQCCGFERADSVADRTATYTLGGEATCTIEWRSENRRFRMVGCRGTATHTGESGGDLTWTFSMMGRAEAVHQATQAQAPAAAGRAYRRCSSRNAEIELSQVGSDGAVGAAVALDTALIGAGLDAGIQLTRPGDITAPDGNALPVITAARPVQTVNTIAPRLAGTNTDAFWALANGEGLVRIATTYKSPDADATMRVELGSAAVTAAEVSDSDGVVGQQITASGVGLADEPLAFVFTTPAV